MLLCGECTYFVPIPGETEAGTCFRRRVDFRDSAEQCPHNAFQKRVEPQSHLYTEMKQHLCAKLTEAKAVLDEGRAGCTERMLTTLLEQSGQRLLPVERHLLSLATCLMAVELPRIVLRDSALLSGEDGCDTNEKRQGTDAEAICGFVQDHRHTLFFPEGAAGHSADDLIAHSAELANALACLLQFYPLHEDLRHCPEFLAVQGERVRQRLLAAMLRLADTLSLDVSQQGMRIPGRFSFIEAEAETHLRDLKNAFVSCIHPDADAQLLHLTLRLPGQWQCVTGLPLATNRLKPLQSVERVLRIWISEVLTTVNPVFARNAMSTYTDIKVEPSQARGCSQQWLAEVELLLERHQHFAHCKGSRLLSMIPRMLRLLCAAENDAPFEEGLRSFHSEVAVYCRLHPEHLAMDVIRRFLEAKRQEQLPTEPMRGLLSALADCIECEQRSAARALDSVCQNIIPEGVRHLVLVSSSASLVSLLKVHGEQRVREGREWIQVHVLTGPPSIPARGTRAMSSQGDPLQIGEIMQCPGCSVQVVPDASLATLFSYHGLLAPIESKADCVECDTHNQRRTAAAPKTDKGHPTEEWLMLTDAEGIDVCSGDCVHSSGHLAALLLAAHARIPVYMVAGRLTLGRLDNTRNVSQRAKYGSVTQSRPMDDPPSGAMQIWIPPADRFPYSLLSRVFIDGCEILSQQELAQHAVKLVLRNEGGNTSLSFATAARVTKQVPFGQDTSSRSNTATSAVEKHAPLAGLLPHISCVGGYLVPGGSARLRTLSTQAASREDAK